MRGLFVKILVGGLLFSFPAALYYFYTTELSRMQTVSPSLAEVSKAVEQKEKEIEVLDGRILQARGEVLKFEEMKYNLVGDLVQLKDRITAVIARNSPASFVVPAASVVPDDKKTP